MKEGQKYNYNDPKNVGNANLFLITGTGILLTATLNEINSNLSELKFKSIRTNIDDYFAEYKKDTDVFFTSTY